MTFDGVRAVVVYDPATGTTAQIPDIAAETFSFSKLRYDSGERAPTGDPLSQSDHSRCSFRFIDSVGSIYKQLAKWENARTRVSMCVFGVSRNVQWYETDLIRVERPTLGGITRTRSDQFDFVIERKGHGRHAIYDNVNLLAYINGIGEDSWQNNSGTAKGYTSLGSGTLSWDLGDNSQSIDHNAEDAGIYVDIVWPFQLDNLDMTLTTNIVDLHSQTNTAKFELISRNFAGTEIANTALEPTATGRAKLTHSLSSSIALYTLRVVPIATPSGISILNIVEGKEPALRTDGKNTFTDQ